MPIVEKKYENNLIHSVHAFLNGLQVSITKKTVTETLKNHPAYPSLLAVNDSLNLWKVDSMAVSVSDAELNDLPTPFLTTLNIEGGIFAVVESVKNNMVYWRHTEKGLQKDTTSIFTEKWTGAALLAESNESSGEKNYARNKWAEQKANAIVWGTIGTLTIGLFLIFSNGWGLNLSLLLGLKLIGIGITSVLLWHQIDNSNANLKKICEIHQQTNCNHVLTSNAATVLGLFTLSELGFFYFIGTFTSLLMVSVGKNILSVVQIMNLLTLPFTFFSLYYQYHIVKKWCILCLAVLFLFWCEFFANWGVLNFYFDTNLKSILVLLFSFSLPICVWYLLEPILKKIIENQNLLENLRNFKNNESVFYALAANQLVMPATADELNAIIIGNLDAPHTVTLVTNPFCEPCKKIHTQLEALVAKNSNIKGEVVLTVGDTKQQIFAQYLFSLPLVQRQNALKEWFDGHNGHFENWINANSEIPLSDDIKKQLTKLSIWFNKTDIQKTPTIFWNGQQLPDIYQIADLNTLMYFKNN